MSGLSCDGWYRDSEARDSGRAFVVAPWLCPLFQKSLVRIWALAAVILVLSVVRIVIFVAIAVVDSDNTTETFTSVLGTDLTNSILISVS